MDDMFQRMRFPGKALFYSVLAALMVSASLAPVPTGEYAADSASVRRPPAPAARPAIRPAARRAAQAPVAQLSLADIKVHTELPIAHWLPPGDFAWNDDGVPAGPVTIVVNIRARVLSAYRSGYEIGRSSITYGTNQKPTPLGTFPILEKDAVHFSNLYDRAPMPHMLRLTMDGVAIHGTEIADDLATHGCIGLPKEFAALLFAAAHVGDRVLIWTGERSPTA